VLVIYAVADEGAVVRLRGFMLVEDVAEVDGES
jgi:hypothetical protein